MYRANQRIVVIPAGTEQRIVYAPGDTIPDFAEWPEQAKRAHLNLHNVEYISEEPAAEPKARPSGGDARRWTPPMIATYGDNPAHSQKDEVRLMVGDTDTKDFQLSDGEITYFIGRANGVPLMAAVFAAESLCVKYARMVDESVGPTNISFSQRLTNMQMAIEVLRRRVAIELAMPFGGGIVRTDVRNNEVNTNIVQPQFRRGMLQTPGVVEGDFTNNPGVPYDPVSGI